MVYVYTLEKMDEGLYFIWEVVEAGRECCFLLALGGNLKLFILSHLSVMNIVSNTCTNLKILYQTCVSETSFLNEYKNLIRLLENKEHFVSTPTTFPV